MTPGWWWIHGRVLRTTTAAAQVAYKIVTERRGDSNIVKGRAADTVPSAA
jgi:hypothetical protein